MKKISITLFLSLGNLAQFDDCFCSSILFLNSATRNITSHLLSYIQHIRIKFNE
jgi:hypothetical protein